MAATLLESLIAEISRLDGEALVMHVGEKPYVVAKAGVGRDKSPVWERVEVSERPLTSDALLGMLGQVISFDERRALYDVGAIEIAAGAAGDSERFLIAASRDAGDVRLEIRRRGTGMPVDARPDLSADSEADLGEADFELEMFTEFEPETASMEESAPAPESDTAAAGGVTGSPAADGDAARADAAPEDEDDSPGAVILPHVRLERPPVSPAPAKSDSAIVELLRMPDVRHAARVHVVPDRLPAGWVDGRIVTFVTAPVVSAADVDRFVLEFRPVPLGRSEWTCVIPGVGPVTCLEFDDESGHGIALLPPAPLRSAAELALEPAIAALADVADGLVVVAGERASGKSTLVHALVDLVNASRSDYVITIETGMRMRHRKQHAIVSQRQRDGSGDSIAAAARAALREGPDVLVIDDLRSPEAVAVALDGARGGRLVIGTLAAPSVTAAMARLVDGFVAGRRLELQALLSSSLRAVVAQTLVECIGGGRVAARELLLNGPIVAPLVCDGAVWHLTAAIEAGRRLGMKTMADSLAALVAAGSVDVRTALRRAPDRVAAVAALARDGIDVTNLERRA